MSCPCKQSNQQKSLQCVKIGCDLPPVCHICVLHLPVLTGPPSPVPDIGRTSSTFREIKEILCVLCLRWLYADFVPMQPMDARHGRVSRNTGTANTRHTTVDVLLPGQPALRRSVDASNPYICIHNVSLTLLNVVTVFSQETTKFEFETGGNFSLSSSYPALWKFNIRH